MALTVKTNLVEGSTYSRISDGVTVTERGYIMADVGNLTEGPADTALSRAIGAVAVQYPLGFKYPGGTRGQVVGWEPSGIRESDDTAKVKIVFDTITLSQTPGTIVVSDNTSTENDTSQFFRDDINGVIQQLTVTLTTSAPAIAAPVGVAQAIAAAALAAIKVNKQYTATIGYEKTMRRCILQTSLFKGNLAKFRAVINGTNDAPWNGLPAFFWRFSGFPTVTRDLGHTYEIQLETTADVNKDVSKYAALRDSNNGRIVVVDPGFLKTAQNAAYRYGIIYPRPGAAQDQGRGLLRVGQYRPISFQALFGAILP